MATIFKLFSQTSADSPQSPAPSSALAGFNLQDLADEGRDRLAEYQQRADQILADARAEADKLCAESQERGYQSGLAQAQADTDQRIDQAARQRASSDMAVLHESCQQMHRVYEQWMRDYAESLNATAIAAAEKIVRRELSNSPEILVSWIRSALQNTRSLQSLTIAVHPQTLATMGSAIDRLLDETGGPESIEIVPDALLEPTDVVIRQGNGEIRAGLDAQLDLLRESLA